MTRGSRHWIHCLRMLPLLLVLVGAPVAAQTPVERAVAAIRAQYEEIGQRIRQSEARKPDEYYGVGLTRSEFVVNKDGEPWRAVGHYRLVYTFWFHEAEEPVQGAFVQRLRKATVTSRVSSRTYYQEFFYDQAGALVFWFRRAEEDGRRTEQRLYYDKGAVVRIVADQVVRDVLTPDDRALGGATLAQGVAMRRLFDASFQAPVD